MRTDGASQTVELAEDLFQDGVERGHLLVVHRDAVAHEVVDLDGVVRQVQHHAALGAGPRQGLGDLVELDAQAGRELADHRTPGQAQHAGLEQHRCLVEAATESHHIEHHRRAVIGVVVDDLHAPDLLHALARAGQRQRQEIVGEARIDAVDEDRRRTFLGGVLDGGDHLAREGRLAERQLSLDAYSVLGSCSGS